MDKLYIRIDTLLECAASFDSLIREIDENIQIINSRKKRLNFFEDASQLYDEKIYFQMREMRKHIEGCRAAADYLRNVANAYLKAEAVISNSFIRQLLQVFSFVNGDSSAASSSNSDNQTDTSGEIFSSIYRIPLNFFTQINLNKIVKLTQNELSALGLNISFGVPRQVFCAGDKIITIESSVNLKTNNKASIEHDISADDIIKKQLSSINNITLSSGNASIGLSDDSLEIELSCPPIKDVNGVEMETSAALIITAGSITPVAQGIKLSASSEHIEVETTVIAESVPQKYGYVPVEVPQEAEIKEYNYSKEERLQFAIDDWKNGIKEGYAKAKEIAPVVAGICSGMAAPVLIPLFSAVGGSGAYAF